MARGIDGLMKHLLEQVALTGQQGASILQFRSFVKSYYSAPPTPAEKSQGLGDRVYKCDDKLVAKAWEWFAAGRDVYVGKQKEGNGLSLAEAEARAEATPDVSSAADTERAPATTGAEHVEDGQDDEHDARTIEQSGAEVKSHDGLRLYTIADRVWEALTGHDEDWTRVTPMEFQLLTIIAEHRSKGIDQRALIHASGQDKRSVPQRTDRLHKAGYILKYPLVAGKFRTSGCILKRFVPEDMDNDPTAIIKDGRIRRRQLWNRLVLTMLREKEEISVPDAQKELDIRDIEHEMVFRSVIIELCRLKVITLSQASDTNSEQPRNSSVQYIRLNGIPQPYHRQMFIELDEKKRRVPPGDAVQVSDAVAAKNAPNSKQMGKAAGSEPTAAAVPAKSVNDSQTNDLPPIVDEDNSKALVLYRPPLWTPFKAPANFLFDLIDRAGKDGMSTMEIQRYGYGNFWGRNLEILLIKLTEQWQYSQPPHLKHLSLIRDTAVTGSHYVYRTRRTFQEAVDAGLAMWEAVEKNTAKVRQRSKFAIDRARSAKAEYDQWGFPRPDITLYPREGYASVADVVKDADIPPAKRMRTAWRLKADGEASAAARIPMPKAGTLFDTSDMQEYQRLYRNKMRNESLDAEFMKRARRHAVWLAKREMMQSAEKSLKRDATTAGLDELTDLEDSTTNPTSATGKRGRGPGKKKRQKVALAQRPDNFSPGEASTLDQGSAENPLQPTESDPNLQADETPGETQQEPGAAEIQPVRTNEDKDAFKARVEVLLQEYLAMDKPGAWYDAPKTRRQFHDRYKKNGVLLVKSERLKELSWFRDNPSNMEPTPPPQAQPATEDPTSLRSVAEPVDESADTAQVDHVVRELRSRGKPDVPIVEGHFDQVTSDIESQQIGPTASSESHPEISREGAVSIGEVSTPIEDVSQQQVQDPVVNELLKHCWTIKKRGRPRLVGQKTLVVVIRSNKLREILRQQEVASAPSIADSSENDARLSDAALTDNEQYHKEGSGSNALEAPTHRNTESGHEKRIDSRPMLQRPEHQSQNRPFVAVEIPVHRPDPPRTMVSANATSSLKNTQDQRGAEATGLVLDGEIPVATTMHNTSGRKRRALSSDDHSSKRQRVKERTDHVVLQKTTTMPVPDFSLGETAGLNTGDDQVSLSGSNKATNHVTERASTPHTDPEGIAQAPIPGKFATAADLTPRTPMNGDIGDYQSVFHIAQSESSSKIEAAIDTTHEVVANLQDEEHERQTLAPGRRRARKPAPVRTGIKRGGGSVALIRNKLLMEIVERCGGAIPGGLEIVDAYQKAWAWRFKTGQAVDRATVQKVMRNVVAEGKLRRFTFAYRAIDGNPRTGQILALRDFPASHPKVLDVQKQMAAAHPRDGYIPHLAYVPGTTPKPAPVWAAPKPKIKKPPATAPTDSRSETKRKTATGMTRAAAKPTAANAVQPPKALRLLTLFRPLPSNALQDRSDSETSDEEIVPRSRIQASLNQLTGQRTSRRDSFGLNPGSLALARQSKSAPRSSIRRTEADTVTRSPAKKRVAFAASEDGVVGNRGSPSPSMSSDAGPGVALGRVRGSRPSRRAVLPSFNSRPCTAAEFQRRLMEPTQLFWPQQGVFATNFAMSVQHRVWLYNGTLDPSQRVAMFNKQRQHRVSVPRLPPARSYARSDGYRWIDEATHTLDEIDMVTPDVQEVVPAPQKYEFFEEVGPNFAYHLPILSLLTSGERHTAAMLDPVQPLHALSGTFGTLPGQALPFVARPSDIYPGVTFDGMGRILVKGSVEFPPRFLEAMIRAIPLHKEKPQKVTKEKQVIKQKPQPKPKVVRTNPVSMITKHITGQVAQRLIITCIIVQILAGGVDGHMNWKLVNQIYNDDPDFEPAIYKQKWVVFSKNYAEFVEDLTTIIQNRFLEAYAAGELPSIDYRDLENFDWHRVVDWAIQTIESSVGTAKTLPRTQEDLLRKFNVRTMEADPKLVFLRSYRHVMSQSIKHRSQYYCEIPDGLLTTTSKSTMSTLSLMVDPLSINDFRLAEGEEPQDFADFCAENPAKAFAIVLSRVRASVFTPDDKFDAEHAHKQLARLPRALFNDAIRTLIKERVVAPLKRQNRAAQGYKPHDSLVAQIYRERFMPVSQFRDAVACKKVLDEAYQAGKTVLVQVDANNGETMAYTNLVDYGRAELHMRLPKIKDGVRAKHPKISKWGFQPGDYATKYCPTSRYRFEIELRATEQWEDGNPLGRIEPPTVDVEDAYAPIPIWQDVHGGLLAGIWRTMVVLVVQVFVPKPWMGIEEVMVTFEKGKVGAWEVRMVIDELERVGALEGREEEGEGKGRRWALGEWWWLCVADTPGDEESEWERFGIK